MLGSLLALALAIAPRHVAVYALRHPEVRAAQAHALDQLFRSALEARAVIVTTAPGNDAFAECVDAPCLAPLAQLTPGTAAVVPSWTAFGEGGVLSAVVLDDRAHVGVFTLAIPVANDAELPQAVTVLVHQLGDRLELPPPGEVHIEDPNQRTFGLALKIGNTVGSVAADAPTTSNYNLRFDLEGDYLAAPEFWPFIDVSLVLATDSSGNKVQLVPLLLGAKYVFRRAAKLRPFVGMALGLDFLSENLDRDTGSSSTFAVYGVSGLYWFLLHDVAIVGEASLNLDGLQASGGSGVIFAVGLNLGAVVLF